MLMRACLPVTIGPRVIAERRRILELTLGYSGAIPPRAVSYLSADQGIG